MTLAEMERQATVLDSEGVVDRPRVEDYYDPLADVMELARREARWQKPRTARLLREGVPLAKGTEFYQDTRPPHSTAYSQITLSTTSLMLWAATKETETTKFDWWPGKRMLIVVMGKMTTAVTPGNLTIELRYGTTDNAGSILATSGAMALIASQTNAPFKAEFRVLCTATGPTATSGSLLGYFSFDFPVALITAANQAAGGAGISPITAPAPTASLDLNSTSALNVQLKRSGSTAETAIALSVDFVHLN